MCPGPLPSVCQGEVSPYRSLKSVVLCVVQRCAFGEVDFRSSTSHYSHSSFDSLSVAYIFRFPSSSFAATDESTVVAE